MVMVREGEIESVLWSLPQLVLTYSPDLQVSASYLPAPAAEATAGGHALNSWARLHCGSCQAADSLKLSNNLYPAFSLNTGPH